MTCTFTNTVHVHMYIHVHVLAYTRGMHLNLWLCYPLSRDNFMLCGYSCLGLMFIWNDVEFTLSTRIWWMCMIVKSWCATMIVVCP